MLSLCRSWCPCTRPARGWHSNSTHSIAMGPSCCCWRTLGLKVRFCFAYTACRTILQWLCKWCSPVKASQALRCARASKIWMLSTSICALNAAIQNQSTWGVILCPRGCRTSCPGVFQPTFSRGWGSPRWMVNFTRVFYCCAFPLSRRKG